MIRMTYFDWREMNEMARNYVLCYRRSTSGNGDGGGRHLHGIGECHSGSIPDVAQMWGDHFIRITNGNEIPIPQSKAGLVPIRIIAELDPPFLSFFVYVFGECRSSEGI